MFFRGIVVFFKTHSATLLLNVLIHQILFSANICSPQGLVSVVTPEEEETEEEHVVVVVTGVGGVVISGGVVEEVPPALSPAISGLTLIGLEGHVKQCAVRTDFIDLGSVFKMTVYWRLKSLNF